MSRHGKKQRSRHVPARGMTRLVALLIALIAVSAGALAGVPSRVLTLIAPAEPPLLTAAAGAAGATATGAVQSSSGGPAASEAPSKLGINVPLELSRPLSAQSARFARDVTAGSLSISGSATFGSPFSSRGAATIDGPLAAQGGISTNGADIDLGSGSLFAANVLTGITAGNGVTITGPANRPTISVAVPQQMPVFFGGGGGGLSSIAAGSGLSGGTITSHGTIALDLGSANEWDALQTFGKGISVSDVTVTGTATTSMLSITSATSTLLKTDADGAVIPAIAGIDYALPGVLSDWLLADGALSPTSTIGILIAASSTIGDGTSGGGLTVSGNATTTGTLSILGSATSTFANGLDLAAGCFSVNSTCIGLSPWTTSGSNISYTAGNVGIGTTSPFAALSVAGDGYFTGGLTASSTFAAGTLLAVSTSTGPVVWTDQTGSGSRNWYSVLTMSSDGTELASVVYGGDIYTSSDSGVTWNDRTAAGVRNWTGVAIASSASTKMAATVYGGDIYTSTDSGATWTDRTAAGSRSWRGIASSADGTKLAAIAYATDIYTSTDSGATWTDRTGSGALSWTDISSSDDGTKLAATVNGGDIYTSSDSGATWTDRTAAGSRSWQSVKSSSDGSTLVASDYGGYIYISKDSGATWTAETTLGTANWEKAAVTPDGGSIVVDAYNGDIYTSSDSGSTWTDQTDAGSRQWRAVAISSDGTKVAGVVYGGDAWTYAASLITTYTPHPAFSVSTGGYVGVGTTTPFAPFSAVGNSYFDGMLTTTGNIGIGTTSPFAKLSVAGDTFLGGSLTATGTVTFANALGIASGGTGMSTAPSYGQLLLGNASGGYDLVATSSLGIDSGLSPWTTSGSNISYTAGNVGVGTTSPFTTFAVDGSGFFRDNLMVGNRSVNTVGVTPIWTNQTGSSVEPWRAAATSLDGTNIVAVASSYIAISSDRGITWTTVPNPGDPTKDWRAVTMSSDGTRFTVVSYGGRAWTHSGSSWFLNSGNAYFRTVTSSSNGMKLAAAGDAALIFVSTDGGVNWTSHSAPGTNWAGLTSSADGTKLAQAQANGYIYTSADSGGTWTQQTGSGSRAWTAITSSSDGTKLAAAASGGYIYTSTDSGVTWTAQTAAGARSWISITSSSDGTKIAAGVASGDVFISSNSGVAWADQSSQPGIINPYALAYSSNGSMLVAGKNSGNIWTYTPVSTSQWQYGLSVTSQGYVGVGVNNPTIPLEVAGAVAPSAGASYDLGTSGLNWGCLYYNSGTLGTCASDERLKTNINDLALGSASTTALDQIAGLRVRSFAYKTATSSIYHGLIAQEVEKVAPELVVTDASTTLKAVKYGDIQWLMLEALQQLIAKVNALAGDIARFAEAFVSDKLTANDELCVGDTCVTPAQFKAMAAAAGAAATSTASDDLAAAAAPAITLLGANPASVALNATYNDLGATAKDSLGHDLGLQYTVNGSSTPAVSLDTSASTVYTIVYTATDTNGLSASTTRTVYVGDATSTPIIGDDQSATSTSPIATTTDATSTPAADATSTPSITTATSTPDLEHAPEASSTPPADLPEATSTGATSTPQEQ